MSYNFLIVEDEMLIAYTMADAIAAMGHRAIGIAAHREDALAMSDTAEIALVDVTLRDGAIGPEIGEMLADKGVTVLFMTGDPNRLGDGVPGTVGVITKPVMDLDLLCAIQYAVDQRSNLPSIAPHGVTLFKH